MTEINIFRHARDVAVLQPGDVLFREGEAGDHMYAVTEGKVTLSHGGAVIEEVGPGSILGEMALIDDVPRSATATAGTEAKVVAVDKQHFVFLIQEHPTFALEVMTVMAERLRRANG
jgi:CRP/FNR family transcriptional regulator, cyclic AMP receptor protein